MPTPRTVVYPGSLDPIHNGHIDIAARAAHLFDQVIVAVYDLPKKRLLFDVDERMDMARRALAEYPNIQVAKFSGLLVNYVQTVGAMAVIRGLRVFSDFEFEFRMGVANKKLAPTIETVAIMADERHLHISSSTVREIAELGGDVSSMVPAFVDEALKLRFAERNAAHGSPDYTISIRD
ncbi:MAG: pantetheine-phosphate adenylyltransferase [Anaerolineae bacterium]|nr:pantetheine-phosphate adenylyltransferase [Anaerolineae bacterium]